MARINESYESEPVPEERSFGLLAEGWYPASIAKSEIVKTRGGGSMLKLQWKLTNGRVVFQQITIENANETAVRIGREDRQRLCLALNMPRRIGDTEELHGRPCEIFVVVVKDSGYEPKNDVKGFKPAQTVGTGGMYPPGPGVVAARQNIGAGTQSVSGRGAADVAASKGASALDDDSIPF